MFLTSLVATLAAISSPRTRIRGDDRPPSFTGILDELFAVWPLEPEEEDEVRSRYVTAS